MPSWCAVVVLAAALGQAKPAAPISPALQHHLASDRWEIRGNAFDQLMALPDAAARVDVRHLLVQLRFRENYRSNMGEPDSDDLFEDDDYLLYEERLTEQVQRIATETNDPGAWKSLVEGRMNPDSVYGNWISDRPQSLPYVLRLFQSPYDIERGNAAYLLAALLAKSKTAHTVSPAQYAHGKLLLRRSAALSDATEKHYSEKYSAVQGLGLTRDRDDIPLLINISRNSHIGDMRNLARATAQSIQAAP